MMEDRKVILFGSFSEDEAKTFAASKPAPTKREKTVSTTSRIDGPKPNGHVVSPKLAEPANRNVVKPGTAGSPRTAARAVASPRSVAKELKQISLSPESPKQGGGTTAKKHGVVVTVASKAHAEERDDAEKKPVDKGKKSWAELVGLQQEFPVLTRKPVRAAPPPPTAKPPKAEEAPTSAFVPRGLVNTGNTCFLNSTLQALLSCPPFCDLLKTMKAQTISQDEFPLLHAFATFVNELENPGGLMTEKMYRKGQEDAKVVNDKGIQIGKPLSPAMFDPILLTFSPHKPTSGTSRTRQEDVGEFLDFLMNRMHDELMKLNGHGKQAPLNLADGNDEWETVGPKNKTAVTRTYNVSSSPLSEIFGGQQDSIVKVSGAKASATVEPFYLLNLDIGLESIRSVEDALKFYVTPSTVEYKHATGKTGDASKCMKIRQLPKILILHLKRFYFGSKGAGKLEKPVSYPLQLTISREFLTTTRESRRYELVATITHHGKEPTTGHYTADTRPSDGVWLRYDDRNVESVSSSSVLHDQAYILFYRLIQ